MPDARRSHRNPRVLALVVALALAVALAGSLDGARAQQPPEAPLEPPPGYQVAVGLDPPQPRLGERARLTITVTHPSDRLLAVTTPPKSSAGLDVIETQRPTSEPLGGATVTEFAYTVAAYELGPIVLGSARLTALAADGSSIDFSADLPAFAVMTTITPQDSELRPLKPQLDVFGAPPPLRRFAPLIASVGAVALLSLLLVYLVRRPRAPEAGVLIPLPPATAEDAARGRLDALRRAGLLEAGDYEGYYGELSLVVRGYLEQRFGFRATALTRRELDGRTSRAGVDRWQARLVSGLLERCDAAVYAHRFPPPASADHDLTLAYEIVELSRPRREPEAVPA